MSTEEWIDAWLARHQSPDDDEAWQELRAWALEEGIVERWSSAAVAYQKLGYHERARLAHKETIRSCSDETRGLAYSNYANFLLELGEVDEALTIFDLAWEKHKAPSVGLGFSSALLKACRDQGALDFLLDEEQSLADLAGYWSNLSIAWTRSGEYIKASHSAEKAYSMDASQENAFQLSLARLRLEGPSSIEGWNGFEARPNRPSFDASFGTELKSLDELMSGDRVVVVCEQGIGDILQFLRYVPSLEKAGARVVIAGTPRLENLIVESFPSSVYVTSPSEALRMRAKFWVPLLSLPRVVGSYDVGSVQASYLSAPRSKFSFERDSNLTRVGLAWKGNPLYPNDHLRSASLEDFHSVLKDERLQCFSLLIGEGEQVAGADLAQLPVDADSEGIFVDTASLILTLDVVISTDTSLAHLSGGLGVSTYLLLNNGADWRWGTPERPNPWYASVNLIWGDGRGFAPAISKVLERL